MPKNNIKGTHKVEIPVSKLILIVLTEICEIMITKIPTKKIFILKFLKPSLLLDFTTTKAPIIHIIGI